jgi:hypothetical protein
MGDIKIDKSGFILGYTEKIKYILKSKYFCVFNSEHEELSITNKTDIEKLKAYIKKVNEENKELEECGFRGCKNEKEKRYHHCWKCNLYFIGNGNKKIEDNNLDFID